MKIAVTSGSISDTFAAALIWRLKQQRNNVSIVIVKKKFTFENMKRLFAKYGLRKMLVKGLRRFFLEKISGKGNQSLYLGEHLVDLECNPVVRLKDIIRDENIPHVFVGDIGNHKSLSHLWSIKPDVIIYAGGGIVKRELLKVPRIGILNAHMGLLPRYRGMNVLEWSLFNNDPIGITVHFMDEGIDTGDILLKKTIPIEKGDTIKSLRSKSQPVSAGALAEVVNKLENGVIQPIKQKKEDGNQYFVMHKRLKDLIEEKLKKLPANNAPTYG